MASFVAITSRDPIDEVSVSRYRDSALRNALYVPSAVRTFVHWSRRTVVIELCGFEASAICNGPEHSFLNLSLFEGQAVHGTEGVFLTPRHVMERKVDPARIHGSFTWLQVEASGAVQMDYDPLLSIPIYTATAAGLAVISDRSSICAGVIGDRHPDSYTATWVSSIGYAVGDRTIFARVRRAPLNATISSYRGQLISSSAGNLFSIKPAAAGEDRVKPYREVTAALLQAHVRSRGPINLGLTGGKDSRLVLALLMDAGLHHQTNFFVKDFGADLGGGADAVVARQLADRFNLRLEVLPRASAMSDPPALDWLLGRLRRHAFAVDAATGGWDSIGIAPPGHTVNVNGVYGEVLKHFFKGTAPDAPDYKMETTILTLDPFSAFEPHAKEALSAELFAELERYAPKESTSRDFADVFYCTSRLPNWAGVNHAAQRNSSLGFAPLYNRPLLALPFQVSYQDRQNHRFHHDVISQISPELADMPFANDKWAPSIRQSPAPVKDPDGIPRHGGWQHTLAQSPELMESLAEIVTASSATWTTMVDRRRVAETLRTGTLNMNQITALLGMLTTTIAESEEYDGHKVRFPPLTAAVCNQSQVG